MRSVWKGTMGWGLFNVPVKLYGAKDKGEISFHLIHEHCSSRIRYLNYCPSCNREVTRAEIKKGYEIANGQYILLDEADFESLPLKTAKQIEILGFTKDNIDLRAIEDTFYLAPEKDRRRKSKEASLAERAYVLLHDAMRRANVKAVGKLAYREREHPCIITPFDSIFILQTLCYAEEIRPYDGIKPIEITLSDKEREAGDTVVNSMMMDFDLSIFKDEYRKALEKLIEAKVQGKEVTQEPEIAIPAGDLVSQLLESIGKRG